MACIDQPCAIGQETKIRHLCHISEGAVRGECCILGQNVFIAGSIELGRNLEAHGGQSILDDRRQRHACGS
jgi:UDP-2-acetamido-3-amino-2,3-dideoxy-glucuronate N-acetyltransferase